MKHNPERVERFSVDGERERPRLCIGCDFKDASVEKKETQLLTFIDHYHGLPIGKKRIQRNVKTLRKITKLKSDSLAYKGSFS